VREVLADPASTLVKIDLDHSVDRGEVTRAIEEAGYHPEPRSH
jgi:hypothetical protein